MHTRAFVVLPANLDMMVPYVFIEWDIHHTQLPSYLIGPLARLVREKKLTPELIIKCHLESGE